jgi:hypothetical protein
VEEIWSGQSVTISVLVPKRFHVHGCWSLAVEFFWCTVTSHRIAFLSCDLLSSTALLGTNRLREDSILMLGGVGNLTCHCAAGSDSIWKH